MDGDPNNQDQDQGEDHLAAAQKFVDAGDAAGSQDNEKGSKGSKADEAGDKGETNPSKKTIFNPLGKAEAPADQAGGEGEGSDEDPELDKLSAPEEKSKHRPDWDKMKTVAAERGKKIRDLEKQIAAAKAAPADEASKARIKQLEQQLSDMDSKLKVHDLKSHPEFQAKFVAPRNAAIKEIKDTLELEGAEADVEKILALEGKAFVSAVSDLLGDLSEFSKSTVEQAFRNLKKLSKEEREALNSVDQLREQFRENFAARARQTFDAVSKKYESTLSKIEVGEDATEEQKAQAKAYNDALDGIAKTAESLAFGRVNEEAAADMAHKAARFDFLVQHAVPQLLKSAEADIQARDEKISALEKQIKDLTESNPGYDGRGSGGDGGDDQKPEGEMDHLSAARKYVTG